MRTLSPQAMGDPRPAFADDEERYRALMVRYQAGDAEAFANLYAQLAPQLATYLAGLDPVLASDATIVDEVFTAMHETRRSYSPSQPFAGWVVAIVEHVTRRRNLSPHRPEAVPSQHD